MIQFLVDNKTKKVMEEKRYFNAFKMILDSKMMNKSDQEINLLLQTSNLKISNIETKELNNFKKEKTLEDSPIQIYFFNKKKYIQFVDKPLDFRPPFKEKSHLLKPPKDFIYELIPPPQRIENIVLIDEFNEEKFKYFWIIVLFTIDVLLIWFLVFLRAKLKPLLLLKENMIKLSSGNLSISTKAKGKDEISQVANEFDNAIKQLRELRESRNLFLRNIMHELKTPITKGKLITDMYEESERKYILIRVFQRLEYLLSEFSKIEELTSGKIILEKEIYPAYDLIEQAFDILLIEHNQIEIIDNFNLCLDVDFELFSIALKNLIDNAITYNTNGNPQILIEKDSIKISNKAEQLKKNIEEYYKPFNHEYEDSSHGLGLGLYISNNIIKIHNFKLEYEYINGYHNFIIKLN